MGVSKNRGTQNGWVKWKALLKWMIWGYPIGYFWKHPNQTLVHYRDAESTKLWLFLRTTHPASRDFLAERLGPNTKDRRVGGHERNILPKETGCSRRHPFHRRSEFQRSDFVRSFDLSCAAAVRLRSKEIEL